MAGQRVSAKSDIRRGEIVAAALQVIERDGFAAATVRAIALEMGCTTGVISHHFRTKEDLTALAGNEVTRTIASRVTAAELTGDLADQLTAIALSMLPDDGPSHQAWKVWLHFLAEALSQPDQMVRHERATDAARLHIADLLRDFQANGLVGPELDADFEAAYLYALIDGLGTDSLISPTTYGSHSFAKFITVHITRLMNAHPPERRKT